MQVIAPLPPRSYRSFGRRGIDRIAQLRRLSTEQRTAIKAVAAVLPFRVNEYILDDLIRWEDVPDDPIFRLTFPQPEMLPAPDLTRMTGLVTRGAGDDELKAAAREIQHRMNPHPGRQMELNVPRINGRRLRGMQHKYRETVLFFPASGQTCHAYCTYCFRWAQFVGVQELRFASRGVDDLLHYLRLHPEVTDVLITGGDPMIMRTPVLARYVEPLLERRPGGLMNIRIGTKAPASWPYRFLTDPDADDLLRLLARIVASGFHLAVMVHYSHPRELDTPVARHAVRRILDTGAVLRSQAPVVRHVNADAGVWASMWRKQVQLGVVPYYMFVARDTGPRDYFEVPLAEGYEIFTDAYRQVSGLARTVRGPSMSATPGKVLVDGITTVNGERVFVLKILQARDPSWVGRVFFARFDPEATWLDQLRPPAGKERFFFDPDEL